MKKSSLIIIGIAALVIIGIFVIGGKKNKTPEMATLTGSVSYLQRIALPENSTITVLLQDVSKMDVAAETIAEQVIETEGKQVPIDFSLDYNAKDIKSENNYSLFAKIESNGKLLWINADHTPVITNENPTNDIEIVLTQASATTPSMNDTTSVAAPLEGTEFTIVAYNGKLAPKSDAYTVSFTDGKVSAKFCNGMGGEYTIDNYVITAPTMISTMMFCESPAGLMEIEQLFGKMLSEGAKATLSRDVLELSAGENKMIFQVK